MMQKRPLVFIILLMVIGIPKVSFAEVSTSESINSVLGDKFLFSFDKGRAITGTGEYYLECKNRYLSVITMAGSIDPENSIRISSGKEKGIIYVEGEKAKFYGGNYMVVKDDADALILFRFYNPSSLTEVISVDKKTGITIDTKTMMISANLAPKTDTYLMNCQ
jgi:hypothetical protein